MMHASYRSIQISFTDWDRFNQPFQGHYIKAAIEGVHSHIFFSIYIIIKSFKWFYCYANENKMYKRAPSMIMCFSLGLFITALTFWSPTRMVRAVFISNGLASTTGTLCHVTVLQCWELVTITSSMIGYAKSTNDCIIISCDITQDILFSPQENVQLHLVLSTIVCHFWETATRAVQGIVGYL